MIDSDQDSVVPGEYTIILQSFNAASNVQSTLKTDTISLTIEEYQEPILLILELPDPPKSQY